MRGEGAVQGGLMATFEVLRASLLSPIPRYHRLAMAVR
jgi:hypothetical protein